MTYGNDKFRSNFWKQSWNSPHYVNLDMLTMTVVKIQLPQIVLKGAHDSDLLLILLFQWEVFNWRKKTYVENWLRKLFFRNFSRAINDLYEYNSEEINVDKIVGDITPVEEKRSHSRAGCDCQLSVSDFFSLKFIHFTLCLKFGEIFFTFYSGLFHFRQH